MPGLSVGIVGLPNVGKSTLFHALTAVSVPAENYPFCTIDPNVGVVEVPDPRLDRLEAVVDPPETTRAVVEFVDIAGLVEGASRGEGLGNQFLGHVRQVDAIAHVVRCFEDEEVARAGGSADPVRDLEVVGTELALADLEVVERRIKRLEKRAGSGERQAEREILGRIRGRLERGEPARDGDLGEAEREILGALDLLTLTPTLYVANVEEEALGEEAPEVERLRRAVRDRDPGAEVIPICAELEAEVVELPPGEREEYLRALGLPTSGLDRLVRACHRLLGLRTFFTYNENELRAWTIPAGATAPEAAGTVHTDFREGFIRADTIHVDELLRAGSMRAAREEGLVRAEGKEYVVRDGDVMLFRTART